MAPQVGTSGEALFDALVDCAKSLVCVFDRDGRIVRFNAACEEATGFAAADVVGVDARTSVIPPEEVNAFTSFLHELRATPQPSPQVGHWSTRDGGRVAIAWTNRPVVDEDGGLAFLVTHGMRVLEGDAQDPALREQLAGVVRLAQEQAALRRVATLAAGSTGPEPVFEAVSAECAALLGAPAAGVFRFEGDGTARVVGRFSLPGIRAFPIGSTVSLGTDSAAARVHATGATAGIAYAGAPGEIAAQMRSLGFTASVGAPIHVHQRLWGVVVVVLAGSLGDAVAQAEEQLGAFAELVALAVAEADSREHLLASRARLVRAADEERRKLERNLHDGAQQRLVSLAIRLRLARKRLDEDDRAAALLQLASADEEVELALEDLRQLANGLHPALLTRAGVGPALEAVARRLPLDVHLEAVSERFDRELEAAVYYVAAEALTNAVKHAEARTASITVRIDGPAVRLTVADDGRGGADESSGTGLRGLRDRVEALRGAFEVTSGPAGGTVVSAVLPLLAPDEGSPALPFGTEAGRR